MKIRNKSQQVLFLVIFLIITTFSTLPTEGRSDNILKNTIEQISNQIVSVDIPDPSGSNLLVGAVSASVNVHAPTLFLDYGEGPGPYQAVRQF